MRNKHSFFPGALDALEDRLVLSHFGPFRAALPVHPHIVTASTTPPPIAIHRLDLNGTLSGKFSTMPSLQSAIPTLVTALKGSGLISALGTVDLSGSITSPISQAPTKLGTQGTITLSNAKGSVTLRLSVLVGQVASPLSIRFEFSIEKGTGAFAGAVGTGSADLTLTPLGGLVSSINANQGTFTLSLHARPPIL